MSHRIFKTFFFAALILTATVGINAQIDASTSSGRPRQDELPKNVQETLKKHEIEQRKKEHEQLLEHGREAVELSEALDKSVSKRNAFSAEDVEKLERLEKLLKKIRKELGGDDDDEAAESDKPASIKTAVKSLREAVSDLFRELKKTSRHTISALAIQSSNSLLRTIRFLRFDNK